MNPMEVWQDYANTLKKLAISRDKVIKRQRYQLKMLNRYITKN